MASISFAQSIRSHVDVETSGVEGATVREALEIVFGENPRLRSYILDDKGAVRKHVVVIVDGETVNDRAGLSDPLEAGAEVFVMQSLSGG